MVVRVGSQARGKGNLAARAAAGSMLKAHIPNRNNNPNNTADSRGRGNAVRITKTFRACELALVGCCKSRFKNTQHRTLEVQVRTGVSRLGVGAWESTGPLSPVCVCVSPCMSTVHGDVLAGRPVCWPGACEF